MKQEEYEKKDGTKGHKWIVTETTKVRALFDEPKVWEMGNGSLLVTPNMDKPIGDLPEEDKVYLSLTKGQVKLLQKTEFAIGDVLVGGLYTHPKYKNPNREDGKFVNIRKAKS